MGDLEMTSSETGQWDTNNTNLSYNGSSHMPFDPNRTGPLLPEWKIYFYTYLWTVAAPTLFSIIIILGIVGNSSVIYVIFSKRSMQTPTHLLLVNLAFSDIAFLLICGPLTAHRYAAMFWTFPRGICEFTSFISYVTNYVTVYTLVAISALRYCTVVFSTGTARYRTKRNVIIVVLSIWILLMLLNIPTALIHTVKMTPGGYIYCGMQQDAIKTFNILYFVFAYAFPLLVICVFSVLIVCHLFQAGGSTAIAQTRSRTVKASKVIILVIVMFGLLWLPVHVERMVSTFGMLPEGEVYEVFRILWQALSYANSCVNPFIYNCASQEFRSSFRQIFCCCRRNVADETEVTTRYSLSHVARSTRRHEEKPML